MSQATTQKRLGTKTPEASFGPPLAEADKVEVTLTVDAGNEDAEVKAQTGSEGLRRAQILRLTEEALEQGGLLTQEDRSAELAPKPGAGAEGKCANDSARSASFESGRFSGSHTWSSEGGWARPNAQNADHRVVARPQRLHGNCAANLSLTTVDQTLREHVSADSRIASQGRAGSRNRVSDARVGKTGPRLPASIRIDPDGGASTRKAGRRVGTCWGANSLPQRRSTTPSPRDG